MRKVVHAARAKYNELAERRYRSANRSDAYDTILVSYGGSGTTFILKYLSDFMRVNSWDSHNDGIKHANSPQHPVFEPLSISRCVYIYSDPAKAALSLFRRDFQSHMSAKLTAEDYRNANEYNRAIREASRNFTLEDMLAAGEDRFGLNRHWSNWTTQPANFPTLFVSFDHLYENIDRFFDFLDLSDEQRRAFPPQRERLSSVSRMDPSIQEGLDRIYGDMARDMAQRPTMFERG
ncbi:hypothetical protein E3U23_07825 [Erythrobacter litoralis]|uniref:hypothetical protein n=1 Tax=Erythrobacter litoralis TaxID=39960 RepID=UPI0024352066|nr:hypothetical protein [Erythrobacter litoralis]MDG6079098.1 hypothetical protein [Erythrobacter litoralis]